MDVRKGDKAIKIHLPEPTPEMDGLTTGHNTGDFIDSMKGQAPALFRTLITGIDRTIESNKDLDMSKLSPVDMKRSDMLMGAMVACIMINYVMDVNVQLSSLISQIKSFEGESTVLFPDHPGNSGCRLIDVNTWDNILKDERPWMYDSLKRASIANIPSRYVDNDDLSRLYVSAFRDGAITTAAVINSAIQMSQKTQSGQEQPKSSPEAEKAATEPPTAENPLESPFIKDDMQ